MIQNTRCLLRWRLLAPFNGTTILSWYVLSSSHWWPYWPYTDHTELLTMQKDELWWWRNSSLLYASVHGRRDKISRHLFVNCWHLSWCCSAKSPILLGPCISSSHIKMAPLYIVAYAVISLCLVWNIRRQNYSKEDGYILTTCIKLRELRSDVYLFGLTSISMITAA